jgi:hypothetical protein
VIAPWQVQELPQEWLEGARAITTRIPQASKANEIIEKRLAAWRASHKSYRS